jgi:hypothetical protein
VLAEEEIVRIEGRDIEILDAGRLRAYGSAAPDGR